MSHETKERLLLRSELVKPPHMVENAQNNATQQYPHRPTSTNYPNATATNHGTTRKGVKKLLKPRLCFGDKIDYRFYTTSEPPKDHDLEMFAECSGEPSTDWQRRWLIRRLIKFNKCPKRPRTSNPYPRRH